MKQYVCSICGYVFDEAKGGRWEDLPENWKCPGLRSGQGRLSGEGNRRSSCKPSGAGSGHGKGTVGYGTEYYLLQSGKRL